MKKISVSVFLAIYIIFLSLLAIVCMDHDFFNNWAGFLSISGIPALIIIANIWEGKVPFLSDQKSRGLHILVLGGILFIAGYAVSLYAIFMFGNSVTPPTVVAMMFVIFTVVMTIWVLLVFQGWPFTQYIMHRVILAFSLLFLIYLLSTVLYSVLFNFSGFGGLSADIYDRLPTGIFEPWFIIVTMITTLAVIFALTLYEQMPLKIFTDKVSQPLSGIFTLAVTLIISWAIMQIVIRLQIDLVNFMVRGPISFLFGLFIVQDTTGNTLFLHRQKFARGGILTVICLVLGISLYQAFEMFQGWWTVGLIAGSPMYQKELWLANAMLSVTFPMIIVIMNFFKGWPIIRNNTR